VRILFDSNILVRAFGRPEGAANRALLATFSPQHTLVLSNEILFEMARVLRSPRMTVMHKKSELGVYDFTWSLRYIAELVSPDPLLVTPIRDQNDIVVLQTAITGRADVLCTSDRDFFTPPALPFLLSHGITVVTDAQLLERLRH
jgi:putative PIN family toxin of toxin-antitoxin system